MNDELEDIARRAERGNAGAMEELLAIGQQHLVDQQFQKAAEILHRAAHAYRSGMAVADIKEPCRDLARSIVREGWTYRVWAKQNPRGPRELPRTAPGIDEESIRRIVV